MSIGGAKRMLDFFMNALLWTLAIYGALEIIRIIIYDKVYSNMKAKDGIEIIITVKNGEEYIEGFIRNLLFKILYCEEEFVKEILIVDLISKDKTNDILKRLEKDYECIRVIDLVEYKNIVEEFNT